MSDRVSDPSRQAEIEARFGASAQAYADSPGHRGGPDLDRVIELAAPDHTDSYLDVATGAGNTALAFAPLVGRVTVQDLAPGMIEMTARRFAEAGYALANSVVCEAENLAVCGVNAFDLVTCRIAPHHFTDIQAAVGGVASVLKPGGRFVMEDNQAPDASDVAAFLHDAESRRDPTHVRSYSREEWVGFCRNAGLRVEHTQTMPKRHDFEGWLARGGCDDATKDAVRASFAGAPANVREGLRIEIDGDRVVAWSDPKLILLSCLND